MNTSNAEQWIQDFGASPRPDQMVDHCVAVLRVFERSKKVVNMGTVLSLSAFLGHAWARWPDQLEDWFREIFSKAGSRRERELLYLALYYSPAPEAVELLQSLDMALSQDEAASLGTLQTTPIKAVDVEVVLPYHLDLHWGAFLGSGDDRHVEKILEQILHVMSPDASNAQRDLSMAAIWSVEGLRRRLHVDIAVMAVLGRRPTIAAAYSAAVDTYLKK